MALRFFSGCFRALLGSGNTESISTNNGNSGSVILCVLRRDTPLLLLRKLTRSYPARLFGLSCRDYLPPRSIYLVKPSHYLAILCNSRNGWQDDLGVLRFDFKYRNRNSGLNFGEEFVLHYGLWKALNLE